MRLLMGLEKRVERWSASRSWIDLPVVIALVTGTVCAIVLLLENTGAVHTSYAEVVTRALGRRDFKTAEIAARRMLHEGSGQREGNYFNMALALEGQERPEEAFALLQKAAPLERPGYARAHVASAVWFLSRKDGGPDNQKNAETHLKHALDAEPGNVEAREILGKIYASRKQWAEAIDNLMPITGTKPELLFLLAHAAQQSKDGIRFAEWIGRAEKHYRNRVESSQHDNQEHRLLWARALAVQEKFDEAVAVLKAGLDVTEKPVYRSSLAELYGVWAATLVRQQPGNLRARIDLIRAGLNYDPRNAQLLESLFEIGRLEGEEAKTARETVTKMLAEGDNSPILHFIAGNDAWKQGQLDQARIHWELAYKLAPDMPAVANNMAMILSLGREEDLPRAMETIDAAIKLSPKEPNLRDTRGRILAKMGKYKDAVVEFEYALPRMTKKGQVHEALAEAYEKLGMPELAAEHRRQAAAGVEK